MGLEDKADAQKDKLAGATKEGAGKLTGDSQTEAEGKGQNLQGKLKDAAESVKDAAGDAKESAKGFTDGLKKD
ncbi:CsbD family protein [Nesterenkonia alba]|uniref:CsbD family protein n=1 Tax=Nesterenkonia alba TaxID=515814 RepID=UPI0003B31DC7|nr:CsbD family protein [Nesterenkonia alba]